MQAAPVPFNPQAAFVPRRQRQRRDRKERRERRLQGDGEKENSRPAPVLPFRSHRQSLRKTMTPARPSAPARKGSVAKDEDEMDNVEDFFDSDSERSSALPRMGSDILYTEAPTALATLTNLPSPVRQAEPTPKKATRPVVYQRTPKFQSSVDGDISSLRDWAQAKTPLRQKRFSSVTASETSERSATENKSASDMDWPLPPVPPASTMRQSMAAPEEINMKSPLLSPAGVHTSLSDVELDLVAVEQSYAPAPSPPASPEPSPKPSEPIKKKPRYSRARPSFRFEPSLEEEDAPSIVLKARTSVSHNSMFADDEGVTDESSLDRSFSQLPPPLPSPSPVAPPRPVEKKKKTKKTNNKRVQASPAPRRVLAPSSPFTATLMSSTSRRSLSPSEAPSPLPTPRGAHQWNEEESTETGIESDGELAPIDGDEPDADLDMSMIDSPMADRSICYDEADDLPLHPEEEDFDIIENFKLSELDTLRVEQIKRILRHYKIPVYGRKAEMIMRLRRHFKDQRAGRPRLDSLAPSPSPSPRARRRSSLLNKRRSRITRTKPLEFWNNERVRYSREKRKSGDFATVVDLIRENDAPTDILPPSKRRKYNEEPFPAVPVYSSVEEKAVPYRAVKNPSMLKWRAVNPQEDSASSDLTTSSREPERNNHPVHSALAFHNALFASGQVDIAPKSSTGPQTSRGSHEFFFVLSGTAELKLHEDTFILKRGCHFYVPPLNNFSISNPHGSTFLSVIFFRGTEYDDESEA